jgi:hypothetical protein
MARFQQLWPTAQVLVDIAYHSLKRQLLALPMDVRVDSVRIEFSACYHPKIKVVIQPPSPYLRGYVRRRKHKLWLTMMADKALTFTLRDTRYACSKPGVIVRQELCLERYSLMDWETGLTEEEYGRPV